MPSLAQRSLVAIHDHNAIRHIGPSRLSRYNGVHSRLKGSDYPPTPGAMQRKYRRAAPERGPPHGNNKVAAGTRDSGTRMAQCTSGCLSPVSLQAEAPALGVSQLTCWTRDPRIPQQIYTSDISTASPNSQNGKQTGIETVNLKRTPTPPVPISASNLHRTPPQRPRGKQRHLSHLGRGPITSRGQAFFPRSISHTRC